MPSITVSLAGGTATIAQDPSPMDLGFNEAVTVAVGAGFEGGATVSKISFFNTVVTDGVHSKGTLIGDWLRTTPAAQPVDAVTCATSGYNATMTDVDEGADDADYFYCVTVTANRVDYQADPELIARKKPTPNSTSGTTSGTTTGGSL